MKSVLKTLVWVVAGLFLSVPHTSAQSDNTGTDSLEVGLLTCAPGTAVYELYGHTAIRVKNFSTGADFVFNYGIFDFSTPNFTWRFMLGQTDYMLGVSSFGRFAESYSRDGRAVEEQVLNLSASEKARLVNSLLRTASMPGWTYRYNFLYDNCTTRAVEEVEECLEGRIEWPAAQEGKTFRTIIHEFSAEASPWNCFGQDLILGAETDVPVGRVEQMFSPIYAAAYFDSATVVSADGTRRPLVLRKEMVVGAEPHPNAMFPLSPLAAAGLLFVVTIALCAWEWRRRRVYHLFDDLLMVVHGVAGCIVALLFFWSEHPAVGSNWLILLLNPLPLLYLPVKVWRNVHHLPDVYHKTLIVALCLFFVEIFITPQSFPTEIYILALILLTRSISVVGLSAKYNLR